MYFKSLMKLWTLKNYKNFSLNIFSESDWRIGPPNIVEGLKTITYYVGKQKTAFLVIQFRIQIKTLVFKILQSFHADFDQLSTFH